MIANWRSHSPHLCFLKDIDQRTGYRSKQMLVAPIVNAQNSELLGVVQLINNRSDTPFPAVAEEGIQALAQTLAVAFAQRQKAPLPGLKTKYDALVSDAILSAAELDLAQRSARRKNIDLEEVLMRSFRSNCQRSVPRCQSSSLFPMSPSCRTASGRWSC
jgi:GAF domain-containing protein